MGDAAGGAYDEKEPRLVGAVDMLRRTGAQRISIRYQDDDVPTFWVAGAGWDIDPDGPPRWKVGAGLHPLAAVLDLCESAMDGGICAHCRRPTAFASSTDDDQVASATASIVCWVRWDGAAYRPTCQIEAAAGT